MNKITIIIFILLLTACSKASDPGPLKGTWQLRSQIIEFRDGEFETLGIITKVSYVVKGSDVLVTIGNGDRSERFTVIDEDNIKSPTGYMKRGLSPIETEKVRSLEGDFLGILAAVGGYKDRFRVLPGDDVAATTHLPGATNATTPTGKLGNGSIDGHWNSLLPTDESFLLWQHLGLAGFINADKARARTNSAGGKMGITSITATDTPIKGLPGSIAVCSDGISGKLAKQLDTMMDDDNTTTGSVMVGPMGLTTAATAVESTAAGFNKNVYVVCKGFQFR